MGMPAVPAANVPHGTLPMAAAPMVPPAPAGPQASAQQLANAAARTLFVDPGAPAQPAGTGTAQWVPGRAQPRVTPGSPYMSPASSDAAARPTMVPGYGLGAPMAPIGTPAGTAAARDALPAAGAQLVDPNYLQAMAQYNAGGSPPMQPAQRDQARAMVELPTPPKSSGGLGLVLVVLLCAAAATGGYFVVHYLTTH
jgi:hypothetical protein